MLHSYLWEGWNIAETSCAYTVNVTANIQTIENHDAGPEHVNIPVLDCSQPPKGVICPSIGGKVAVVRCACSHFPEGTKTTFVNKFKLRQYPLRPLEDSWSTISQLWHARAWWLPVITPPPSPRRIQPSDQYFRRITFFTWSAIHFKLQW